MDDTALLIETDKDEPFDVKQLVNRTARRRARRMLMLKVSLLTKL